MKKTIFRGFIAWIMVMLCAGFEMFLGYAVVEILIDISVNVGFVAIVEFMFALFLLFFLAIVGGFMVILMGELSEWVTETL